MPHKKSVTCITITTDASFHHGLKAAGYAFYIVCDLFKIHKGGQFKTAIASAEEAEIKCIGNAVATLLAQKELPTCRWLIINTDCVFGIKKIKKRDGEVAKQVAKLHQQLVNKLNNPKNKFRHVKAHTNSKEPRSLANAWCDREAKKWMRVAAEKIKNNL